jgi:hypothetical protein
VVEDAQCAAVRETSDILRDPDRFERLKVVIDGLAPLKLEMQADRNGEGEDVVKAARARDRLRVWRSIWRGLNDRALKRAMLPPAWCRQRDRAMLAASKALWKLHGVLNESTADPSLLGLSFSPVMREFHRFVREAWSQEPIDPNAYGGRGPVLRTLLGGTPRNMGLVEGRKASGNLVDLDDGH